jgi:DNA polymerase III delta prime subunit
MIGQADIERDITSWVTSEEGQQPILLISHSRALRKELSNFAKRVAVCEKKEGIPCGVCNSCKQSDANAHPDTMTILGEKDRIRVRDISALRTILVNTSMKRVVCIPHAEDLLPEAANALLKTLEEPTKNTRFLLCAPSKRSVLPTIRSRCKVISINAVLETETAFSSEEALKKLADLRPAEPFQDSELLEISRLIHQMTVERGVTPALFKVSLRLRDYYKTASFSGGNTKLAADILLASLANLRNTTK